MIIGHHGDGRVLGADRVLGAGMINGHHGEQVVRCVVIETVGTLTFNLIPGGSAVWSHWKLNAEVLLRQRGATTLLVLNNFILGVFRLVSEAGFSSFEKDGGK